MDLSAEYYLQTLETVFIDHLLPRGLMRHRGKLVDLKAIHRCALMTIEGEKDDITGRGQTVAALDLTPNLPDAKKEHHLQAGVGHYGVFNGSRFRHDIAPRIKTFMARHAADRALSSRRSPTRVARKSGEVQAPISSLLQHSSDQWTT
jgi:poly(3-hydroxybutyrate) depolymerase